MVTKVIELKDVYDNLLLPYAFSAHRDGNNNDIVSTYATITTVNTKQDTITGAATSVVSSDLPSSKVLISNVSGKIATSSVTSNEIEYLSGTTANVQTQINDIKDMIPISTGSPGDVMIINSDNTALEPGGSIYRPALLTYQPADHLLNDIQWLRADTFSWQSGDVYKTAYNHLVSDFDSGEIGHSDTFGGVTVNYRLSADKHKICLQDQEQNVAAMHEATGIAWYYILDKVNKRFKLPRRDTIAHGRLIKSHKDGYKWYRIYSDGWCEQGDRFYGDVNGWQNNTATLLIPYRDVTYHVSITSSWSGNGDGGSYYYANNNKSTTGFVANITQLSGSYGFATWKASGYTNQASESSDEKYLYFYVGAFTQSAIEETAGIAVETLNNKLDIDLENSRYPQFDCVIAYKMPTAADPTWYRKYKSGWLEQGGKTPGASDAQINITFLIPYAYVPVVQLTRYFQTLDGTAAQNQTTGIGNLTVNGFRCYDHAWSGSVKGLACWEARGFTDQ